MSSSEATTPLLAGGGARPGSLSAEIMVASILFLLMAIIFVLFVYVYVKWRWGPGAAARRARQRELLSVPNQDQLTNTLRKGLDAAFIQSLPVSVYKSEDSKEGLECSVCLSELVDGENARILPNCNHGFHLDCIDTWFKTHATCPICRNPVGPESAASAEAAISTEGYSTEALSLPTNVLFWGTLDEVSTGGLAAGAAVEQPSSSSSPEGMLVIEIPSRAGEAPPTDEKKSPVTAGPAAATARLRSFKRLFSRGKSVAGTSCGDDIEQGVVGQS